MCGRCPAGRQGNSVDVLTAQLADPEPRLQGLALRLLVHLCASRKLVADVHVGPIAPHILIDGQKRDVLRFFRTWLGDELDGRRLAHKLVSVLSMAAPHCDTASAASPRAHTAQTPVPAQAEPNAPEIVLGCVTGGQAAR